MSCDATLSLSASLSGLTDTLRPILLVRRAQKKRKETGDDRYWAPLEKNKMTFSARVKHILARPFIVLFKEPMLIAITVYMSVCIDLVQPVAALNPLLQFMYGCIYLLFESYPIVFGADHGLSMGFLGLTYIPIFVGACFAVIL